MALKGGPCSSSESHVAKDISLLRPASSTRRQPRVTRCELLTPERQALSLVRKREGSTTMCMIANWLTKFLVSVCTLFIVTTDSLIRGKRGNLPPPQGGLSSF